MRTRQRGVSLATAIFVLLLLSGVAAYIASLSGSQHAGTSMDIISLRSFQAARSGAEYGVWNAIKNNVCPASQTLAAGSMSGMLSTYTVVVACTTTSHVESGATIQAYSLTATACNSAACPPAAPGANYVERQITMTAWK